MNSNENVLQGFEWECDTTVGFARGQGYQGVGISRTIFLHPDLESIPENLFAVKVSKSSNQQKQGRIVFKYVSYRMTENDKPMDLAPAGIDLSTPLDQIKAAFVNMKAKTPSMSVSLNIGLKGKFTTIACADGTFKLYDEDEADFKTDDPNTTGNAPYYIKSDAKIHVKLKGAMSKQGNPYIQTTLSSTLASSEIFAMTQKGQVWNPEANAMPAGAAADDQVPVW